MSSIGNLVKSFVEIARDLRPEYIEAWLTQKSDKFDLITDYDMDMTLIEEKKHRISTYKKIAELST